MANVYTRRPVPGVLCTFVGPDDECCNRRATVQVHTEGKSWTGDAACAEHVEAIVSEVSARNG